MKNLFGSFRAPKQESFVTIVSGLPRSGTSMMMKMLEAGGIPPITDHQRTADEDNPKGYYEFERVKKLADGDNAWVADAQGKTVKVISALLEHLPPGYSYKVVFMRREMGEILASQKQMLIRADKPTDKVSDDKLAELYSNHLAKIAAWMESQPGVTVLYIDYNAMLRDPRPSLAEINRFLDGRLDESKMAEIVDPSLYRQRR
jgi:Sulfotransferase domain